MRYSGILRKIQAYTLKMRNETDNLITAREQKKASIEAEINKRKGQWTEEYIEEYRKNMLDNSTFGGCLAQYQKDTKAAVYPLLDKLENNLTKVFTAGIDANFSRQIIDYKTLGVKLTQAEMDSLMKKAKTYPEMRLLQQYIRSNAENGDNTGGIDWAEIDKGYTLPDADSVMKDYTAFRNEVSFFIDNYCGQNGEIADLLPNGQERFYAVGSCTFHNAEKCKQFYEKMEKLSDFDNNDLTEEERQAIDNKLNPAYPNLCRTDAKELSKKDPEWAELLSLDDRYSPYITE